ncbi:MAG: hypothetical protein QOJ99_441 [Bryobacterales bacterium]|jgi:hypothetical protein|nr:hypothetical protein [Bryobacterales bacterium]
MNPQTSPGKYLTASTPEGMLIIHGSPVTLGWVPRDVVNDAYNVGGIVIVGTFDSVDAARAIGAERYSASPEAWQVTDVLPFDIGPGTRTEVHTPEIDGHKIVRHGIRWK